MTLMPGLTALCHRDGQAPRLETPDFLPHEAQQRRPYNERQLLPGETGRRSLRGEGRQSWEDADPDGQGNGDPQSTVRRWLRRDHWALWMEHWASVEDIWEAEQQHRAQLPQQVKEAKRQADRDRQALLMAHLDCSLTELTTGHQVDHAGVSFTAPDVGDVR